MSPVIATCPLGGGDLATPSSVFFVSGVPPGVPTHLHLSVPCLLRRTEAPKGRHLVCFLAQDRAAQVCAGCGHWREGQPYPEPSSSILRSPGRWVLQGRKPRPKGHLVGQGHICAGGPQDLIPNIQDCADPCMFAGERHSACRRGDTARVLSQALANSRSSLWCPEFIS